MKMKIDEHKEIINQLRAKLTEPEDVAKLIELTEDYQKVSAEHDEAIKNCEIATKKATEYAELNNKLFLERPTIKIEGGQADQPKDEHEHAEKTSYEELEQEFMKEIGGNK